MIEVKISGKCKGCPALELDVVRLMSALGCVEAAVNCKNALLCEHLEHHIKSRLFAANQADEK